MKKFKIEVTRTDEYEIEVDESKWTPEELENWSKVFHHIEDPQELAEHLAVEFMRNDSSYFIEGFGYVRELRSDGSTRSIPVNKAGVYTELPDDEFTVGLTIKPIVHDSDYSTNTTEIK